MHDNTVSWDETVRDARKVYRQSCTTGRIMLNGLLSNSAVSFCVIAALAFCAPLGCDYGRDDARLQGVVVILLDTVRADHLGCYGHERPTSPNIDSLAREGVLFTQAVSTSPWTLPSVAAMLAGSYYERVFGRKLTSSVVESIRSAGIKTAAFTEGGYVSRFFEFDRGFETWSEEEGAVQLMTKPGQRRDPRKKSDVDRTFAAAEKWLSECGKERFFLFLHTYEPHTPYTHHDFTEGLDAGRVGPAFTLEDVEAVKRRDLKLTESEIAYVRAM